jgi:4-amino-4-deoxy-L-arabinose transferase-like glycosyltransferase
MKSMIRKLAASPERSIVVLGLVLLLAGNWIMPLADRDEVRFSEASREMLQRANYVVPWFNGQWRFDKPILIYWCQSASYRLLGVNGFAARLPSALFTIGTALVLVRWGRKVADAETAFIAGAMFMVGLHVAVIGRVATADMAMVFFVTLAVWSGWELTRPGNSSRTKWWMIFYTALALGFLAKGPVAWLPIAGVVLGRALRKDSFRLGWFETMAGLVVTIALVACWGIPALKQTQGHYWEVGMGEHVIHRSLGVMDSHGIKGWEGFVLPLPYFFLTFILSFLPWTTHKPELVEPWLQKQKQKGGLWNSFVPVLRVVFFFLYIPMKIWRWWPERRRDILGWYLLVQALVVFVVFSLVKTKLPHYTMPAFPCIALWLALQLRPEADVFGWFQRRFAVMVIIILAMMLGFTSFARSHLITENLWQATRPHVRPETKVGCFGYIEPSLVWKFRGVITNTVVLGDKKNAKNFLTNTPPFILVLPTADVASLPDTNGLQIRVHGLDTVSFRNWDLTAIVR